MELRLACPHCGRHVVVDSAAAGTMAACPVCAGQFVVPTVAATPPPVPPANGSAPAAGLGAGAPPPPKQNLIWLWVIIALILAVPCTAFLAGLFIPAFARAKARAEAIKRRQAQVTAPAVVRPRLDALSLGPEFEVRRDAARGLTSVHSSREKRDATGCSLYIADADGPFPRLVLRCLRVGEDRFAFEQAVFKSGTSLHTFRQTYGQAALQQRIGGQLYACQDFDLSLASGQGSLKALIAASSPVTIRFLGRTYEDVTLTRADLDAMRAMLELWEKLRGLRPL